jgi:hypothetical protein
VQVVLSIPNLQYRSMVKSIRVHHQITPINYQVTTLHTIHANFNYDISTMDLHKNTQNSARIIHNISLYGLLSRPR